MINQGCIFLYFVPRYRILYIESFIFFQGAFAGLMVGFAISVVRMIMDFIYIAPRCGEPDDRSGIAKNFHYMYFALVLFAVVLIVDVGVSLLTEPPLPEMVSSFVAYWRFRVRQSV